MGTHINNHDLLSLRSYTTANDATQYSNLHESTLVLNLTHSNLTQRHIEIRFDKHTTVSSLRDKIYQQTGAAPHHYHYHYHYHYHTKRKTTTW